MMLKKYLFLVPFSLFLAAALPAHAASDFQSAAQLLSAAKNADITQVQALVNAGADVNYVDATGLSLVCTALMNNDVRAAQILQMYGADASKCDQQIKKYKNKKPVVDSGGLFSGLSSAQSMTLAAAGAAVVIGGVLMLGDAFGGGNGNGGGGGSTGGVCRPGATCNCAQAGFTGTCNANGVCANCTNTGSGGAGGAWGIGGLPYGPAMPNATSETASYTANLNAWNPEDVSGDAPGTPAENSLRSNDFAAMSSSDGTQQNYLLMMHGYSPLARGYLGQRTFRDSSTNGYKPLQILNDTGGGKPVAVALVTANGVNPTGSAGRGNIDYATSAAADSTTYSVDKYMNYYKDGGIEIPGFDLSGNGTVFNTNATETDLAKIVAGWEANGRPSDVGDLYGFIPNGQLAIYRTGEGLAATSGGSINIAGLSITIGANTYTLTDNGNGTYKYNDGTADITVTPNGNKITLTGGSIYEVHSDNSLWGVTTYKNWAALKLARNAGVDVMANTFILPALRDPNALTVSNIRTLAGTDANIFANYINYYYANNTGDTTPGVDALLTLGGITPATPVLVMSAGEFAFGVGNGKTLTIQEATFENYAPMIFPGLEHLFMTVVAVAHANGTAAVSSISGYTGTGTDTGKLGLTAWRNENGTTVADAIAALGASPTTQQITDAIAAAQADDDVYASRACGRTAGHGSGDIDPWCFAAAGDTAAQATAAASGAYASLKSAFSYMTNAQLFTLMALTSSGYMLGTDPSTGKAWTGTTVAERQASLTAYLQTLYSLPSEYQARVDSGEKYLDVFSEVYGYGLINLERATKPTTNIYYYDGTNIVSGNGNAYWRNASATNFRLSGVTNLRGTSINASFYDVLESVDGDITLPRVWENEFALGTESKSGLYMGDVLGEFRVHSSEFGKHETEIGNMSFSMSFSDREYADNLGGLENMQFGYKMGDFDMTAGYQHYMTDGMSRFDGTANPILSLASNAIGADVKYNYGKFAFGGRAFSGSITDEGLLENDPTLSGQYTPEKLGMLSGGEASASWNGEKFSITAAVGNASENNTFLGSYTDGLLGLSAANTTYVDAVAAFKPVPGMTMSLRSTFAKTNTNAVGEYILGMSAIESNAFSAGLDFGGFSFAAAMPLAISAGSMQYAHADYEVIGNEDGGYDLSITDTYIADLDLKPDMREVRFSGAYRQSLGAFTDGAVGFIYRVNPNHTDAFGDESILMFKLSHRLGI